MGWLSGGRRVSMGPERIHKLNTVHRALKAGTRETMMTTAIRARSSGGRMNPQLASTTANSWRTEAVTPPLLVITRLSLGGKDGQRSGGCLLYTFDAADE